MIKGKNLLRTKQKILQPALTFSSLSSKSDGVQAFQPLPNLRTCINLLQQCARQQNLPSGKQLHCFMLRRGFLDSSPLCTTSLINMYSKCNSMPQALSVFDASIYVRNVFAYNAIIAGSIANELPEPAFEFFKEMRVAGVMPDKFTFPCVIRACSDVSGVLDVKKIHALLFKFGLEYDEFIGSALVHSYLNSAFMEDAQEVFEELPVRDVVLWNAMINGYAQNTMFDHALDFFKWMSEEGVVASRFTVTGILSVLTIRGDLNNGRGVQGFVIKMGYNSGVAVLNALIDMYGKCTYVKDALEIFETMTEKDIFSWNSIICVHEQCGDHEGTLELFNRMLLADIRPDLVTVTAVLPACANLVALKHGRMIHGIMITNGLGLDSDDKDIRDIRINNAVMDMYSKCGSMKEANLVFDRLKYKDVASWNIMIMGYGMHGFGNEALDMFSQMCEAQLKPDEVTFVGVLSACSHGGLVSQGRELLTQLQSKYGVSPTIEHYTCVIDMLGRAGQIEEAYELLSTMPIEANPIVWRAFLAACRLHGSSAMAEIAALKVLQLQPEHCGSYVLMSNVYGAVGRFNEVSNVRNTMKQQNVMKTPGCSWIEMNNGVHTFLTGDRTHPEEVLIYAELNSLTARLLEHAYVPDILQGCV